MPSARSSFWGLALKSARISPLERVPLFLLPDIDVTHDGSDIIENCIKFGGGHKPIIRKFAGYHQAFSRAPW